MTDMYLLFEWTEEREAKIHIGIFTSADKARKAALVCLRRDIIDNGGDADEAEAASINWEAGFGQKVVTAESVAWMGDQNEPYEIEEFEVDTVTFHTWDMGERSTERLEL